MTDHPILHRDSRLLFCKVELEIHRNAARALFETDRFGSCAPDTALCAAILVGQLEHQPMTALKLADYVGMPRATVARKLRELQEMHLVEVDAEGRACLATSWLNDPRVVDIHRSSISKIRAAVRRLSNLDGLAIALTAAACSFVTRNESLVLIV